MAVGRFSMIRGEKFSGILRPILGLTVLATLFATGSLGQSSPKTATQRASAKSTQNAAAQPRLVVLLVVDQMRGDYVDKFSRQWNGGLKRLLDEGAWFHEAAYPYAATETCPGHATISTGAFPATHGMVGNAWWDRGAGKMVTCTADPAAKDLAYAGASTEGGDSAWRMEVPAFADELKFQSGKPAHAVSLSLKARA